MIPQEIKINEYLSIYSRELNISHARSGGPGGQNVNKVSTKIILRWDLSKNDQLTSKIKQRILSRCTTYLVGDEQLLLNSSKHRSQSQNLDDCVMKLQKIVKQALQVEKRRVPTKMPKRIKQKRYELKKKVSQKKKLRQKVRNWD